MKLLLAFSLGLSLATAGSTHGQAEPIEAALLHHIAALSDDAMGGRKPGTPGGERAVRYVASEMQAAGLAPGMMRSWYQTVDLVERKAASVRGTWRNEHGREAISNRELILLGGEARQRIDHARLIFAGYGLEANLAGADMDGAIVLILPGTDQNERQMPSFEARRAAIIDHRAAAVVMIATTDARNASIRDQYHDGLTLLAADLRPAAIGAMANTLWRRLAAMSGRESEEYERAAQKTDFRAIPLDGHLDLRIKTAVSRYRSVNVIGRIDGAERPGEALLYSAHWDHLGLCRRPGVSDRICNGAVDNASGIAVMLEVARGLAQGPKPGRTILFVATTAEEMGLLGARAFARNPPIPAKAIVAALNLDTVALAARGAPVAIIGRGTTPLDPLIDTTARALGRKVDSDTDANALIARQDGWEFTNAGIPAVMIGGAFSDMALLESFFASRYHGQSDDIHHGIELGGAAEDTVLHVALGRLLADPTRFPTPAR
jgi:hypothetical protein